MHAAADTLPAPQAALVCRARAAEARLFSLSICSAIDRALWLDVARLWDVAAATGSAFVRARASQLAADALARLL